VERSGGKTKGKKGKKCFHNGTIWEGLQPYRENVQNEPGQAIVFG
jgi:hypothetical protein